MTETIDKFDTEIEQFEAQLQIIHSVSSTANAKAVRAEDRITQIKKELPEIVYTAALEGKPSDQPRKLREELATLREVIEDYQIIHTRVAQERRLIDSRIHRHKQHRRNAIKQQFADLKEELQADPGKAKDPTMQEKLRELARTFDNNRPDEADDFLRKLRVID